MRKWYRRRRYSRKLTAKEASVFVSIFVFLLLFVLLMTNWKIFLPIALSIGIGAVVRWRTRTPQQPPSAKENIGTPNAIKPNRTAPTNSAKKRVATNRAAPTYSAKQSLMTNCEKAYFDVLQKVTFPNYTVQPQINLASIIDKANQSKYRSELFRNVDFGVFDKNYSLLLLIEINDKTHYQNDRIARDKKVHEICEKAGIPLVTFWTHHGMSELYIYNRLSAFLPLLNHPTNHMRQNEISQDGNTSRSNTTHNMKLNPRPFSMIKNGQKSIEMRLFDEKRQRFNEGDTLIFANSETGEQFIAGIKKIHHFSTFEELYNSLPLTQCGYTADEVENASPADMEQYYSIEQQRKYGVVGIELFPPKQITE